MPESDLDLLIRAAGTAAEIALPHWRNAPKTWDKDDGTPVSEADLAVDRALRDLLLDARPDHAWLSEEAEDDPARLTTHHTFILDPIDGTKPFLAGEPDWGHSIALVHDGRVVAGVVYLPAKDALYAAALGQGATLNGAPIHCSDAAEPARARLLAPKSAFRDRAWSDGPPGFERHFRSALAWRLCLVAEGAFDAMLTVTRCHEWDIAAGTLIAAEAGCRVTDAQGAPLSFNAAPPATKGCLAAPPPLHAATMARLAG